MSVKIFSNINHICWLHTPLYRLPVGSIGAHPSVLVSSRLYRHPISVWLPVCSTGDNSAVLVTNGLKWLLVNSIGKCVCVRVCALC